MFWDKPGRENTGATVREAVSAALDKNIEQLVVASNEGDTAEKLLEQNKIEDHKIICVTHQIGFREPGIDEMGQETRQKLQKRGVKIYTGTHLLAGVDRSLRKEYGGLYPPEIMANTFRMFGQGLKVCVEIAVMALDAGLIEYGKPVIAVGGTGRGADTAAVIKPSHSDNIFDTKIKEILCRPEV